MLWTCDGCGAERECDPLAYDDWGGAITPLGPDCPECDIPMDPASINPPEGDR